MAKENNTNLALIRQLSASSHAKQERELNDYYATPPFITEAFLEALKADGDSLSSEIWEPAAGERHIEKILTNAGHSVICTDIVQRTEGVHYGDFLNIAVNGRVFDDTDYSQYPWILENLKTGKYMVKCDIVTNPPYSLASEFYEHACELVANGHKVCMFVKIQFLETQKRYELFKKFPPKKAYICVNRVECGKNGDFGPNDGNGGAACYIWLVYEKGYEGKPEFGWINSKD